MAEVEPFRQVCPGCHRSLKIRVEQIPDADFTIQCPKCRTEVEVRVAAIRAAMARPGGREPSNPSRPGRDAFPEGEPVNEPSDVSGGFGAQDLTASIIEASQSGRNRVPSSPRAESSASRSRSIPRNAPRTSPKGRAGASQLPWPMIAGVSGGIVVLVLLAVLLLHHGGGGGTAVGADNERSVEADVKAIQARYKDGAGGEAADLFRSGLELFRGDSSEEHRQAAEYFRRAVVAAPHHPEPMAALALNSLFLPKSDRDGVGVTQAAGWADYVQRTMPDSVLGGTSRAALLASLGQEGDARSLLEKQLGQHSDSPLALFVLGHITRGGDPKAAAESFRRVLALDPGFKIAQTELARVELDAGRLRLASNALSARRGLGGPSGMSDRVAADLSHRLGDDAAARSSLAAAVTEEPKDVDTRLEYGWTLAGAGDLAGARAAAQHVLDVDKPDGDADAAQVADAQLLLGEIARREGKAQEAVRLCATALNDHRSKAQAGYLYGLALLAIDRPDKAADALKDAASKDTSRVDLQIALGAALLKAGRVEDAVGAYQAAIQLDAGSTLAHAALASLYVEAQQPMKAHEEWDAMIRQSPPLAPVVAVRDPRFPHPALDLKFALDALHAVEAGDPNRDASYRVYEAALYLEAGRTGDGLAKLAAIRGLDPGQSAFAAGWLLAFGRANDAVRLTARAETAPQQATRGWALKSARATGADRAFAAALASDPDEPYANLGMADILLSRGQTAKALPMVQIAQTRLGSVPVVMKALFDAQP